jgi:hypothetical protein
MIAVLNVVCGENAMKAVFPAVVECGIVELRGRWQDNYIYKLRLCYLIIVVQEREVG